MVWYIAFTALLNLGLGYGLAIYFGSGRPQLATPIGDDLDDVDYTDSDIDE